MFFFLVMNQIFGNLSAVELFIKERPIFMLVLLSTDIPTIVCSRVFVTVGLLVFRIEVAYR